MNQLSEQETETLLREGLDRLAERAPDGHEVRNALARARQGRRRSRPRLALAAVAAAVIAVTAGVPIVLHAMPGEQVTAAAGRPIVSFTPGWLPDGFTEQYRSSGPGITPQVRRWLAGPGRITLSAYSTADPDWSQTALRIAALKDQVVVGGRVGMVTGDTGTAALLTWMADDRHVLTVAVEAVPDARTVAQDVAESVTTDDPARVRGEARFGPLPGGLREFSTTVQGGSPGDGSTALDASADTAPRVAALHVTARRGLARTRWHDAGSRPRRHRRLPRPGRAAGGHGRRAAAVRPLAHGLGPPAAGRAGGRRERRGPRPGAGLRVARHGLNPATVDTCPRSWSACRRRSTSC